MIGEVCISYGISSIFSRVHSWFSFVLNAIIPFTLLIYMNFVIVKTVRNSRKIFRTNDINTGMNSREKAMKNAENQLTIMLLLVTTLFFILLCPAYFRFIYLLLAKRDTPPEYAISMILFQVTYKLYTSNSGINFFLYLHQWTKIPQRFEGNFVLLWHHKERPIAVLIHKDQYHSKWKSAEPHLMLLILDLC